MNKLKAYFDKYNIWVKSPDEQIYFNFLPNFVVLIIFALNKFVGFGNQLQEKVLGSYYSQMEEINEATGMEVYNLDKKAYSAEELIELKKLSIY